MPSLPWGRVEIKKPNGQREEGVITGCKIIGGQYFKGQIKTPTEVVEFDTREDQLTQL